MPNSVKELNKILQDNYGYNLVALPKSGIEPLQVLYKKHTGVIGFFKNLFGDTKLSASNSKINEFLGSDIIPVPQSVENDISNELQNDINSERSASANLELMLKFLKIPSLSKDEKSKLEALISSKNAAQFQLGGNNAKEVAINQRKLDSYISNATIKDDLGNTFASRLKGDELYIIISVLKSNSFTLSTQQSSEQSVKLNFDEIKALLAAKTELKLTQSDNSTIKFEGTHPIIFAFKAVQLIYDKNLFTTGQPSFRIKDKDGAVLKSAKDVKLNYLDVDFGEAFEE